MVTHDIKQVTKEIYVSIYILLHIRLTGSEIITCPFSCFTFEVKTHVVDKCWLLKDVEGQANDLQSTPLESLSVLLCSLTNHVKWHFVKFRNNIIFVKKVFFFFR